MSLDQTLKFAWEITSTQASYKLVIQLANLSLLVNYFSVFLKLTVNQFDQALWFYAVFSPHMSPCHIQQNLINYMREETIQLSMFFFLSYQIRNEMFQLVYLSVLRHLLNVVVQMISSQAPITVTIIYLQLVLAPSLQRHRYLSLRCGRGSKLSDERDSFGWRLQQNQKF